MKPSELRIGNLASLNGEIIRIDAVDILVFSKDKLIFDPVIITEELLLKSNFKEEYRSSFTIKFTHKRHNQIGYDWNKTFGCRFRFYGQHIHCVYFHNLQNLYLALIGEELTIKPL